MLTKEQVEQICKEFGSMEPKKLEELFPWIGPAREFFWPIGQRPFPIIYKDQRP